MMPNLEPLVIGTLGLALGDFYEIGRKIHRINA